MKISYRLLTAALIFGLASVFTAFAADWPQWRGPNRDGKVMDVVLPATWPKTLKEEWKVTVGVGHASPVLANGRVYVFARQGEDEVLQCLDANSGKETGAQANVAYSMHEADMATQDPSPAEVTRCCLHFGIAVCCHERARNEREMRKDFYGQYQRLHRLRDSDVLRCR